MIISKELELLRNLEFDPVKTSDEPPNYHSLDEPIEFQDYKFRAECVPDVFLFLGNLYKRILETNSGEATDWGRIYLSRLHIDVTEHGEVEASMSVSGMDLNDLRVLMAKVPDGHVMAESLNFEKEYTGIQWYYGEIYKKTPFLDAFSYPEETNNRKPSIITAPDKETA